MKKITKQNTPLVYCLKKYAKQKGVRMHMPSHLGRLGFLPNAEKIDITELGFNDNLNAPNGVIKQAQEEFAKLFDAKNAIFLTNGSSQGNMAFLSILQGKTLLVQTKSHISVKRGAKLFGVNLIFVDELTTQVVQNYLQNDAIDGVLAQYPDYYGNIVDLKGIFALTKAKNKLFFVDGAHGAHFGLNSKLPPHPVGFCDACVVSTHKTLGAFTQTAVVLSNDDDLTQRLKNAINLISTTSPSYILMASIDYCRFFASTYAKIKLDKLYDHLTDFVKKIPNGINAPKTPDFTKLRLDFEGVGASGKTAYEYFATKGIFAELYDDNSVLFYLGYFTTKKDLNKLLKALKGFVKSNFDKTQRQNNGPFEYVEEV